MKISSKEQLIDFLSEDLGWRKKELYTHRLNLKMANSANQPIYLRSAVVMLYAHWEGFIKQAATSYLRFIKGQKLKLNEASTNIVALSLKQKINDFIGTNKPSLHIKFIKHLRSCDADRVMFTENDVIRTESNLSSKVLEEILYALAIPDGDYALKSNMIDNQLLYYRNNIAHGNYIALNVNEYDSLHNGILDLLNQFTTDISNAAVQEKFKR